MCYTDYSSYIYVCVCLVCVTIKSTGRKESGVINCSLACLYDTWYSNSTQLDALLATTAQEHSSRRSCFKQFIVTRRLINMPHFSTISEHGNIFDWLFEKNVWNGNYWVIIEFCRVKMAPLEDYFSHIIFPVWGREHPVNQVSCWCQPSIFVKSQILGRDYTRPL